MLRKSIISNMHSAKAGYTYLQEQSTAMSNDSIYTPEDIAEVNAMITELNLIAVSLTVSEPTPIIPEPIVEVVN